jgi:hypothetical protein
LLLLAKKASVLNPKLEEELGFLVDQIAKLDEIRNEYLSDRGNDFDSEGATDSVVRWHERTTRLLSERVNPEEASKFNRLLNPNNIAVPSWTWDDLIQSLAGHLIRLFEDIVAHPDDPVYKLWPR